MAMMFKGTSMGFHVNLGSVGFKLRSEHAATPKVDNKMLQNPLKPLSPKP